MTTGRAQPRLATILVVAALASTLVAIRASTAANPEHDDFAHDFAQAAQAYVDGRYDRAQSLFEGLFIAGCRNGDLFFNLGNTYYQRDDLGEAIRAYRRAELYEPRDPDLRHNLAVARGQVAQPVGRAGLLYAVRSFAFWYDLSTHRELALASVAAWVALCAAFAWRYASGSVASGAASFAAALGLALLGGSWGAKHYELTRVDSDVVVNGEAEVHAGPSATQPVAFTAAEGTEVTSVASEGGYRKIVRADGRQGWIRSDQLVPVRLDQE